MNECDYQIFVIDRTISKNVSVAVLIELSTQYDVNLTTELTITIVSTIRFSSEARAGEYAPNFLLQCRRRVGRVESGGEENTDEDLMRLPI